MKPTAIGFCVAALLLTISPAFSHSVSETGHQFKKDEIYHAPPPNPVVETAAPDPLDDIRGQPKINGIYFFDLKGTIYSKSLSKLSDFESILYENCNVDHIEDGALCSSPFKRITFNHNEHLPQLTKPMFETCSSLTMLSFIGKRGITSPSFSDDALSGLPSLEYVSITEARDWKYVPKTFLTGSTKLTHFYVFWSNITYIEKGAFDGLINLKELFFGNDQLERIDQGVLSKLTNLKGLKLSDNKLESFPWDDLVHLPNLETLLIDNNKINMSEADLLKVVKYLPKLKWFDFVGNAMSCEEMKERLRVLEEKKPNLSMYPNVC